MSEQAKFTCQACGKQYTWKPELAGKRAKCKCGQMMTVPQQLHSDEPDLDALYDLAEDEPARPARTAPQAAVTIPAQQAGARCPSCSAPMQPGAVLCVNCGFNLKTGKKMGTAVGGSAPPPIQPPAARPAAAIAPQFPGGIPPTLGPKRMQQSAAETDPNQKKMVILGAVAILLIAGLIGGFVLLKQGAESNVVYHFEDKEIMTLLDEQASTEIKAFLENNMFSLMGMTTSQARQFGDNLYKLGAKDVRAFDGRVSRTLVVELPDDPDQRKAIIDHYNRYHQGMLDVRPATDEGQRYLKYRLKIANI